jgi:endoglucanase
MTMRSILLTTVLILYGLGSCSQSTHTPPRIPIDPKRWSQLNNASASLSTLFNGNKYDKVNTTQGALLNNYDAYYPLLDGEEMTITGIKFFDWEGTTETHPMTLYAVFKDWEKVPIAVFTGTKYNEWVGPDPANPEKFTLSKAVSGFRYLVINSWGNFPGEIEFYGNYKSPKPAGNADIKAVPLKDFFGVNVFEWDFEAPEAPMIPDPGKLSIIINFSAIRHYADWEKLESQEGQYSFAPTSNGGWNYDTIYQWCNAKNIDILVCLKTIPKWMQATYPDNEKDDEDIPMRYGRDPKDPGSYIEQAKLGFQFAARYGSNTKIDHSLLHPDSRNKLRTGLNLVKYIECDNERDKWWKGRKAYQTGREYAANLSAFYDGDKNKMGPGVGVHSADPSMKVVMAGLAMPSTDYLRGMIDWCKEYRGYRSDGSVDCPWDVINYHFYANDASTDPSKHQTTGIAPELARADSFAREFINTSHLYLHDMPVWVTETGYDINPASPQKAAATPGKQATETQADWILRTSLLYARSGIQKVFFYQLYDDNAGSGARYATCGLVNKDKTARPAANYISQVSGTFGDCLYKATVCKDPLVDKYDCHGNDAYMLVIPDQKGRTANYNLWVGSGKSAFIYKPAANAPAMTVVKKEVTNEEIELTVTETPMFVKITSE